MLAEHGDQMRTTSQLQREVHGGLVSKEVFIRARRGGAGMAAPVHGAAGKLAGVR